MQDEEDPDEQNKTEGRERKTYLHLHAHLLTYICRCGRIYRTAEIVSLVVLKFQPGTNYTRNERRA